MSAWWGPLRGPGSVGYVPEVRRRPDRAGICGTRSSRPSRRPDSSPTSCGLTGRLSRRVVAVARGELKSGAELLSQIASASDGRILCFSCLVAPVTMFRSCSCSLFSHTYVNTSEVATVLFAFCLTWMPEDKHFGVPIWRVSLTLSLSLQTAYDPYAYPAPWPVSSV